MAKISSNNILAGSITSDKLDPSVASGLVEADNANTIATIASTIAAAAFSSANTLSSILANSAPIITTIQITDSSYNAIDDTAANTTGGFVVITGSGFVSTPTVIFGSTAAPAISFISSTTLQVQVPALTAASYPVYVVNSNGGTGIRINGLTTSSFPAWSTGATLANTTNSTAFSVSLSASSDSSITYSNTTVLPAGTTLAANGLFSGTVSVGADTTFTFGVKATDVQLQDADRTFSMTVTIPRRLFAWGFNGNTGQLGFNDRISRSSPTQVGAGTTWLNINTGYDNVLATKTDGTLWTWGSNLYGHLGLNDTVFRSSPTQLGVATNWSEINTNGSAAMATKTDGTLWAWGRNNNGQLGFNDTAYRSSPVQVGSGTNWSQVGFQLSIGFGTTISTMALKTDGTLWAWGVNSSGQLGQNNSVAKSSPVQVGTHTNWSKAFAGGTESFAIRT